MSKQRKAPYPDYPEDPALLGARHEGFFDSIKHLPTNKREQILQAYLLADKRRAKEIND